MLARDSLRELHQLLLLVVLELVWLGGDRCRCPTQPLPQLSDLCGVVQDLRFLQLHLFERLVCVLRLTDFWVKEEGPARIVLSGIPLVDCLWSILVECNQIREDGLQTSLADELLADANDARPLLLLQFLLVLQSGSLLHQILDKFVLVFHREGVETLILSAVGVAVL